jgi:hypothetical protein
VNSTRNCSEVVKNKLTSCWLGGVEWKLIM